MGGKKDQGKKPQEQAKVKEQAPKEQNTDGKEAPKKVDKKKK